jgi:hypothetical protein
VGHYRSLAETDQRRQGLYLLSKQKGEVKVVRIAKITDEQFVLAWVEAVKQGEGIQEVAKKLDVPAPSVKARVYRMRKNGVNLPRIHSRVMSKSRVEDLNAMLAKRLPYQKLKERADETTTAG